jgi:hypothetical protein
MTASYFNLGYSPDQAWDLTTGRLYLEIVPAVAVLIGGLILIGAANRVFASIAALLAGAGGLWLVIDVPVSVLWHVPGSVGSPVGGPLRAAVDEMILFTGIGAAALFFAALALGRFSVTGAREVPEIDTEADSSEWTDSFKPDATSLDVVGDQRVAGSRFSQ